MASFITDGNTNRDSRSPPETTIAMAASALETLPRIVATSSILPCLASSDWLRFRAASRGCRDLVHEGEEADALWRLAQVRDHQFAEGTTDEDGRDALRRSIRCRAEEDEEGTAFLSTVDVFTAPTAFVAWKHWRKIDLRLHPHRRRVLCSTDGRQYNNCPFLSTHLADTTTSFDTDPMPA